MSESLRAFIANTCHVNPQASVKLGEFLRQFHATLPEPDRRDWSRSRLILELGREFPVGLDSARVLRIGGLSFAPPAAWAVLNGRLTHT